MSESNGGPSDEVPLGEFPAHPCGDMTGLQASSGLTIRQFYKAHIGAAIIGSIGILKDENAFATQVARLTNALLAEDVGHQRYLAAVQKARSQ